MKKTISQVLSVLALLAISGFALDQDIDLSGVWEGQAVIPEGEEIPLTLTLRRAETGYAGTAETMGEDFFLENIKFEKGIVTFEFTFSTGGDLLRLAMELKLDGEKLAGSWSSDQGDSGSAVFERRM